MRTHCRYTEEALGKEFISHSVFPTLSLFTEISNIQKFFIKQFQSNVCNTILCTIISLYNFQIHFPMYYSVNLSVGERVIATFKKWRDPRLTYTHFQLEPVLIMIVKLNKQSKLQSISQYSLLFATLTVKTVLDIWPFFLCRLQRSSAKNKKAQLQHQDSLFFVVIIFIY